ncbi:MAG TPA: hypothetical protein VJ850_08475 [Candidatus Limnocylindrales bacterium]|nr:hypothetical protein [Candidatus Limnocylindrales bacterium]
MDRRASGSRIAAGSYLRVEALLLAVGVILLGGAALLVAQYGFSSRPEVVLTMIILLGIVVLLVAIGAFVTLLQGFNLADARYALGLPDGSVRAILALGLLLIFALMSIFLYWDAAHPSLLLSAGLSADQVSKFAPETIVSIQPGAAAGTFDVRTAASNANASQLGQQLVTIMGTLVTAIAAFYFGATSVASATGVGSGQPKDPAHADEAHSEDAPTLPTQGASEGRGSLEPSAAEAAETSGETDRERLRRLAQLKRPSLTKDQEDPNAT